jgi:hypothetical protein
MLKHFKILFFASVLVGFFSQGALSENSRQTDMNFSFYSANDSSEYPSTVNLLSEEELINTEGKWFLEKTYAFVFAGASIISSAVATTLAVIAYDRNTPKTDAVVAVATTIAVTTGIVSAVCFVFC